MAEIEFVVFDVLSWRHQTPALGLSKEVTSQVLDDHTALRLDRPKDKDMLPEVDWCALETSNTSSPISL